MEHQLWMDRCALPPHYDDLLDVPEYSCSVRLTGNFLRKQELDAPKRAAKCRSWSGVQVELRGTLLVVRSHSRPASTADSRSYTLQAADAGLATDYHRRSHVLRIRAEGQQFLLAAASLSVVVDWVDKLNAAIAVSSPLEDRRESRYHTVPPSSKPALNSAAIEDRIWRSVRDNWGQFRQQRIWLDEPQQYPEGQQSCPAPSPGLHDPADADNAGNRPSKNRQYVDRRRSSSATCPCAHCWATPPQALSASVPTTPVPEWTYFLQGLALSRETSLHSDEAPTPRSSTSEIEGKWEPKLVVSTARAKLDYAKGCARVLTYAAPWKDKCYIRDGQVITIRDPAATCTGTTVALSGR